MNRDRVQIGFGVVAWLAVISMPLDPLDPERRYHLVVMAAAATVFLWMAWWDLREEQRRRWDDFHRRSG